MSRASVERAAEHAQLEAYKAAGRRYVEATEQGGADSLMAGALLRLAAKDWVRSERRANGVEAPPRKAWPAAAE